MECFISSTFKDMNDERSYLSIFVLPAIRNRFMRLGIKFSWTDLRWGITDEESEHGFVISRCLQAIDRSDVFLGIIGDYYGTVLSHQEIENLNYPNGDKEALFDYISTSEHTTGISITELEVFHGVINCSDTRHVCFFFKKMTTIEDERVTQLKREIENRRYKIYEYGSVQELGTIIFNYLDDIRPKPVWDKSESLCQRLQLESYLNDIHIDDEFKNLDENLRKTSYDRVEYGDEYYEQYYHHNNHYITGSWGCGKTSLLANWINKCIQTSECNIVYYFLNNTSRYHTAIEVSEYYCQQILSLDEFGKYLDESKLPKNPVEKLQFLMRINFYDGCKPLVIVLDGIENLIGESDSNVEVKQLSWIGHVHPSVLFVASGRKDDDIFIRRMHELSITGDHLSVLPRESLRLMTESVLARHNKALSAEQIELIDESIVLRNPSIRKCFINLLISCENHTSLPDTIEKLASAQTETEFFYWFFSRIKAFFSESSFEVLSYLSLSREGLYGFELCELLFHSERSRHFNPKEINGFLELFDEFISVRDSVDVTNAKCFVKLKSVFLKDAISQYCLDLQQAATRRKDIIELLNSKNQAVSLFASPQHKIAEILFQLFMLQDHKAFYKKITEIETVRMLANGLEFARYWISLYNMGNENGASLTDYFKEEQINSLSHKYFIQATIKILLMAKNIGHYSDSIALLKWVLFLLNRRGLVIFSKEGAYIPIINVELVTLIIRYLELSNMMECITLETYYLYMSSIHALQERGQGIPFVYTYRLKILYAEALMLTHKNNLSNDVAELVYSSLIKMESSIMFSRLLPNISFEQQQYEYLLLYRRLLMFASNSNEWYRQLIVSAKIPQERIIKIVKAAIRFSEKPAQREQGLLYIYAYLCDVPRYEGRIRYLEEAISIFKGIEAEGVYNENCNLVFCYALLVNHYREIGDKENVNKHLKIIEERFFKNRWDMLPNVVLSLKQWRIIKEGPNKEVEIAYN